MGHSATRKLGRFPRFLLVFVPFVVLVPFVRPADAQVLAGERNAVMGDADVAFGFDVAPMVGTSSAMQGHDIRAFSLNLFGGYAGGVEGAEIGSMLNVDRTHVRGAQLSGALNVVGGEMSGAQLAGGANVVVEDVTGVEVAGAANVAVGDVAGLQLAGALNVGVGDVTGAQVGGALNVAVGDVAGVQVGAANYAGEVHGVQVGALNIAEDSDFSLGVLNIIWGGRTHIDVWGGDTGFLFTGVKNGGDHFHYIYGFGVRPAVDDSEMALTLGIGGHIPILSWLYADIDVLAQTQTPDFRDFHGLDLLTTVRAVVGFEVTSWLALYGGPTLSTFTSDQGDGARYALGADAHLRDGGEDGVHVRVWPGFVLGVQLL